MIAKWIEAIKNFFIAIGSWLETFNKKVDDVQEDISEAVDAIGDAVDDGQDIIDRVTKKDKK